MGDIEKSRKGGLRQEVENPVSPASGCWCPSRSPSSSAEPGIDQPSPGVGRVRQFIMLSWLLLPLLLRRKSVAS